MSVGHTGQGLASIVQRSALRQALPVLSGNDHLVMLTDDGDLYTLGCGEQGQLGRVPELFANRGGRQGLGRLLVPRCVLLKSRGTRGRVRFQDAFCGAYFTFAISCEGHVYGFGLSNYHQLGESSSGMIQCPGFQSQP